MEIENVDRTRFNILRQDCRSVAEGVDWLRQNRGRFRRPIYEPLILSVWDKVGILCTSANRPTLQLNMKNLEMAKYLENRVSFNDMSAFFCEDKEDMNQLMRILRDEMRLHGINVVHAPPSDEPSTVEFLPRIAISELRFVYTTNTWRFNIDFLVFPEIMASIPICVNFSPVQNPSFDTSAAITMCTTFL